MNEYNTYKDSQLLVLLGENKKNSEKAFSVLWSRYAGKLRQYCFLITNNREDAEDAFQSTWLKFYDYAKKNKNIVSVPGYLASIAHFECCQRAGNEKNIIVSIDEIDIEKYLVEESPIGNYEAEDLISTVKKALSFLDNESRDCFALHWFLGFGFLEIAEITGSNYETVKKRCYRDMEKVINILKPILNELQ